MIEEGVVLLRYHTSRPKQVNTFQAAVLGFAGVIFAGAVLLSLPISSADRTATPFLDALFTSATSVCVTGLVVRDTGTYWSFFGQCVILFLIQTGGLGVVTVAASFSVMSGRKIGLLQRSIIQEAVAAPKMGGVVRLTVFIIRTTLMIELLGAIGLATVFCRDFGFLKGIWMAIFHSVSAFCNAGIDLMGVRGAYSSLTSYIADPMINLTVISLIVVGGIGFLTWDDIRTYGFRIRKYRMQSKAILTATGFLILIPTILFFLLEFSDMPFGQRALCSLFQAVTPRTAGFNTADLTGMSEPGQLLTVILMLIGGSPGSTAGGMKTTTCSVLLACGAAVFCKRDSAHMFGRRLSQETVAAASTLATMYFTLCIGCAMAISYLEGLPILTCIYETASAIGTVGLSLGITPGLGSVSKIILICLMYLGRVGGLTLIYAAISGGRKQMGKLPLDKITVG